VINAVLIDLPFAGRSTAKAFREVCWALDVEPECVDVTSYDCRANGVTRVPTIRVYDDGEPYGEPLAEHRGAATEEEIRALIERGKALV
jgi:hypothetical protein